MINVLFDRCNKAIEKGKDSKIETFRSSVNEYIEMIKKFTEEISEEELAEFAAANALTVDNDKGEIKFNLGSVDNDVSKKVVGKSLDLRDEYNSIKSLIRIGDQLDDRFQPFSDCSWIVVSVSDVGRVWFYFEDLVLRIQKADESV